MFSIYGPEPAERFLDLINALVKRFPEHPPYGNPSLQPTPHLTVATMEDDRLLKQIERSIQPHLPLAARAAEAWIVEYGDDGCHTRSRITLGESDPG